VTNDAGGASGGRPQVAAAFRPSPTFLLVIACFAASGAMAWASGFGTGRAAQLAVFAFVASGWLISLCLHEFGHAFSAWRFGDRDVAVRGYLTLNPESSAPVLQNGLSCRCRLCSAEQPRDMQIGGSRVPKVVIR
jgi:hypothetical protein